MLECGGTSRAHAAMRDGLPLLGLVLLSATLCLPALTSSWSSDCGAWMLISRLWRDGVLPYRDVWDNKPPAIYALGLGFWMTGVPRVAMYICGVGATSLAAGSLYFLCTRLRWGRATAFTFAGLAIAAAVPVYEEHLPEGYAVGLMLSALTLTAPGLLAGAPSSLRRSLASGLLAGGAAALHLPMAANGLLLLAFLAFCRGPGRGRMLAGYAGGAAVWLLLIAAVASAEGFLGEMWQCVVVQNAERATGGQTSALPPPLQETLVRFQRHASETTLAWIMAGVGLLGVAGMVRARRSLAGLPALALTLFLADVATTFLGGMQWRHYHYPLCWSAGLLLAVILAAREPGDLQARRGAELCVTWAGSAAILVAFATSPRLPFAVLRLARGTPEDPEVTLLTQAISTVAAPQESVVLVDDYRLIGALAMGGRSVGTRHALASMYTFRNQQAWTARARMFLSDLPAEGPDWIVRASREADELTPVLKSLYDPTLSRGRFDFFRRRR